MEGEGSLLRINSNRLEMGFGGWGVGADPSGEGLKEGD